VAPKQAPLQSLVTFKNSQGEAARGTLLKFERTTVVFEVYNPYSIVQLSEVLSDMTVRRGDSPIYRGRAIVSNLVNTGLMLIVSARFIDPWDYGARSSFGGPEYFRQEAFEFLQQWDLESRIRDGYQSAVISLRSYLSELNHWLQRQEAENVDAISALFETYDGLLEYGSPLLEKIQQLNEAFEQEACKLEDEESDLHRAFAQRELHPLIMSSPYPHRTFNKPLGYAGDYEMMNMIHREVPEGPNPYAKLVNTAYVRLPIAESVRNRARLLEDYLVRSAEHCALEGRTFSTLSVGCGPALEVQRFIRNSEYAKGAQIVLMDFNPETLEHAEDRIRAAIAESGRSADVAFLQRSVHALLKDPLHERGFEGNQGFDFVYCAGLFDYLSDKVCARLIRLFHSWTKPGGRLLVTNMHERTLNRYLLEHQAEWFLIYRNERQMLSMGAGLGPHRTFTDATGINLCLEVERLDTASPRR
jgi:extracellular factor (EF) 3-hydroxypalmitic acid methyl ester biosynthesis protein